MHPTGAAEVSAEAWVACYIEGDQQRHGVPVSREMAASVLPLNASPILGKTRRHWIARVANLAAVFACARRGGVCYCGALRVS